MKRIVIVTAILLCSLVITTIVFAQQLKIEPVEEVETEAGEIGLIIPISRPPRPDYTWYQGVAVNKYSLTTKPFYVMKINYGWETYMYVFTYDEYYGLKETYNRYDWRTGTRILKYQVYDGSYRYYDRSVMTLIERGSTLSGTFKNSIISIQRIGPYPIILEKEVQPVFERAASQISKETGIGVQTIMETQTSQ